ncbi:MAG: hypothetical protein CVV06_09450 [Gammaproteobacteria bacterium HGW-Gammaproteobacteria-10]|nr:MAG: hypothetical protein CVV06_09450 [Gammaproteobacteria bacterium HGW-Gammaproteobacteria-10]
MLLIVNQAGIAGGQIAWMRQGKVLKAHEYGPCPLDTGTIPADMTDHFAFVDSAECSQWTGTSFNDNC